MWDVRAMVEYLDFFYYYAVPNEREEIRVVFNGTICELNKILWFINNVVN